LPRLAYDVKVEAEGQTAMWTRPDSGDAPVSGPVPSYSAVKAIFENILLGFNSEVRPVKVEICSPLQYHSYYTNYGGPLRAAKQYKGSNSFQLLATVLIDVCYRFYAEVTPCKAGKELTEKTSAWDKRTTSPEHAYAEIFNRRLQRGQCYATPFFGWKEFTVSYFGPFRETTKVCSDLNVEIPSHLRQVFSQGYNSPVSIVYDQNVKITNGVFFFDNKVKYDQ
jgi:CRISPR-associated protein Cas5d